MKKRFDRKIPGAPLLKRERYNVPSSYSRRYAEEGVKDPDEQMVLFHLTQFGGFRMQRIPKRMKFDEKFRNKWCVSKRVRGGYSFRATPTFLQEFGDIQIKALERIWRNGCVKKEDMVKCGYSDSEIRDIEKFLKELNHFYSSIRVGVKTPASGLSAEDRIQLARFQSIPFLVFKPFAGGRLFHPETSYQRIGSSLRRFLTINGDKTAELDICAATLQFLNVALEKRNLGSIEDSILSRTDPYEYFLSELNSPANLSRDRWTRTDRDTLKTLVYTAIYSNEADQESHLSYKLRIMGSGANYREFVGLFPEFFKALSALRKQAKLPLHMVINREESNYARVVLEQGCLVKGIPILPLHDSFITTASNVGKLDEIMKESSNRLYGKPLIYKRKF